MTATWDAAAVQWDDPATQWDGAGGVLPSDLDWLFGPPASKWVTAQAHGRWTSRPVPSVWQFGPPEE